MRRSQRRLALGNSFKWAARAIAAKLVEVYRKDHMAFVGNFILISSGF